MGAKKSYLSADADIKKRTAARAEAEAQRRQEALDILGSLDCLQGVPNSEVSRLLDMCVFRAFPAGTTVFSENQQGRFLFLVLEGTLQLRLRDKDGHDVLLGVLGQGDCCGEGPLFGDFFRRVGALTQTLCYMVQLPLDELRPLLTSTPIASAALRQIYMHRLIESTLARVPLFSELTPTERSSLGGLLQPNHFQRNVDILHQGEPAKALYLIEAGQVVVEQNGQTVALLDEGDFFGEMALLGDQPHQATIHTMTPTDVLALPAEDFHRLLDQRPDLKAQMQQVAEQRTKNNAAVRNDKTRARELMLAVNNGLLRGSHLLVRTPELCPPDCHICEQACQSRHGRARIQIDGTAIGKQDVLDTCRQCSVGAECAEACPEAAFEWNDNGALVITDKCTGCGDCVPACPYDVVARVPRERRADGPLALLHKAFGRLALKRETIPLEPIHTHRADKCDLCHGYDDLACLSACPTGSLELVPVQELFPL